MKRPCYGRHAIKTFLALVIVIRLLFKMFFNHSSPAATERASLAFVVSQCQEPMATTELIIKLTHSLRRHYDPSLIFVCKCGMRNHCSYAVANVGRETQTFIDYIIRTYSMLCDVTVFVNGGFATKHHTLLALKRITRILGRNILSGEQARRVYIDRDVYSIVFNKKNYSSGQLFS